MRKMDEMEQSIVLESMRWSWGFGIISLAIYNIYHRITTGDTSFITLIIMLGMFFIQRSIYIYKIQEVNEDKSFKRFVLLLSLLLLFLISLLFIIGIL